MLSELSIRDLVIVESVDVSFVGGLNVLTGETGSGKSILVKALKLVLGAKGGADVVRAGAEQAVVEALFELPPTLRRRLGEHDLPDDEQLVVRRTIRTSGRSRATINGHLVTLGQLRALARGLVDISSQHEHHSLVDPTAHLHYLDAFAGHPGQVARVAERVAEARAAAESLAALRAELQSDHDDMWRWQAQELDQADPQPGELDEIDEELARLEHGELLLQAAMGAEDALYGRDQSICRALGRHEESLVRAAEHDPALGGLVERLASARTELEEVAVDLGRYSRTLEADPARIDELRQRRQLLLQLCRKHATDLDGLLAKRRELSERLAMLDDAERHLARAEATAARTLQQAGEAARELSAARHAAAATLGAAITGELADLGMGAARVEMAVSTAEATGATALVFEGARLSERGLDHAELLIAPNPGEPPRPLSKVASGGELSRSLLAIKRVLAGLGPVGLYVFDEVDTGVGGAIAESIAQKLVQVATHHQVLCITHQAPIAAYGHDHYVVAKTVRDDRTFSRVEQLAPEQRVEELARMLGGLTITDTTRSAARELLQLAR